MAASLAASRSFIVISESVSTVEVSSETSPVTLRAVPPLAVVLSTMKIFSRSTSEPSFTDSLNFRVSTPVPSSRAGAFGAAVSSVGAVVSAVTVNWYDTAETSPPRAARDQAGRKSGPQRWSPGR